MAQGLGEALLKRLVYDADGQMLTASFMDYALPRASDIPEVVLAYIETPRRSICWMPKTLAKPDALACQLQQS